MTSGSGEALPVAPEALEAPVAPVVLVTGATGGIGGAVARAYAARGASVVLLARSRGLLEALSRECVDLGGRALVTVADVADAAAVDDAFAAASRLFGRVDVVVHAAAVVAYGRHEQVPAGVWDQVIRTNVIGTGNLARSALAHFRARGGGNLVIVGSVLSQATVPLMGSYVTSKWAIRGLVRVLQQETREQRGVRVAVVHPGSIATPIYTLAGNYAGRVGRPPPPVYSPETVARKVLKVVDRGRRAAGVSVTNPIIRAGFTLVPPLYDALVLPLMRVAGLRRQRVAEHPGNVFVPSEDVVLPTLSTASSTASSTSTSVSTSGTIK